MENYQKFQWKSDGKIFKGVGIYHLTFSIPGKMHLFGEVCGATKEAIAARVAVIQGVHDITNEGYVKGVKNLAWVEKTPFGKAVDRDIANFESRHPGVKVCQYKVMDTHLHAVLWVYQPQKRSILEMAQGFRTGITKIAREMGVWPVAQEVWDEVVERYRAQHARRDMDGRDGAQHARRDMGGREGAQHARRDTDGRDGAQHERRDTDGRDGAQHAPEHIDGGASTCIDGLGSVGMDGASGAQDSGLPEVPPYHVVEKPFVRTLSRSGQKRAMIDYVILNPYRKWIKRLYPELFTMHKGTVVEGLHFRSMGNHWLLDWPERQMVECSRSEIQEDWDKKLERVLLRAFEGAVTYTAAVNKGESYIARKVREAGYPLVVLMKDGFPPIGSESEKYFKPGGVYFDACKEAKLLLMEGYPVSYEDVRIVKATDAALKRKAEERRKRYEPLPHDTNRWRFMAGNEMMRMMSERG